MTAIYRASRVEPYSDGSFSVLVAPNRIIGEVQWCRLNADVRRHTLLVTRASELRGYYCRESIVLSYAGAWPAEAREALVYARQRVQMYDSIVAAEARNQPEEK